MTTREIENLRRDLEKAHRIHDRLAVTMIEARLKKALQTA